MARPFSKSLEEQLAAAQEELIKAEEKVVTTKQKIADLNHAIRERDKENVFALLEAKGMTVDDFKEFLAGKNYETKEKDGDDNVFKGKTNSKKVQKVS